MSSQEMAPTPQTSGQFRWTLQSYGHLPRKGFIEIEIIIIIFLLLLFLVIKKKEGLIPIDDCQGYCSHSYPTTSPHLLSTGLMPWPHLPNAALMSQATGQQPYEALHWKGALSFPGNQQDGGTGTVNQSLPCKCVWVEFIRLGHKGRAMAPGVARTQNS